MRVCGLQAEAAQVGEDSDLYDTVSAYADGLLSANMLLKAYREYTKSHHKVFRFEQCFGPLQGTLALLRDERVKIPVAESMMRLWLRTCFWHHSRKVGSISKAVSQMLEEGLVEHTQQRTAMRSRRSTCGSAA